MPAVIFLLGLALIITASWCGQKIDQDISLAPASKSMRLFLRYGSGGTAIFGFIYIISGFFVFGWWTIPIFIGALIIQYPFLKICFRFSAYMPLICLTYITLSNFLCLVSLYAL